MKVLALIFTLCFVGALSELSEERKAEFRRFRTECVKETSVDETLIDKAKNGEWMEDDTKLQCFFACMMKKIKTMNEDGTLNEEESRKRLSNDLSADKVDQVMNKCKDIKGDNFCMTALKFTMCVAAERAFIRSMTEKNE